jgi:hypothetical protein
VFAAAVDGFVYRTTRFHKYCTRRGPRQQVISCHLHGIGGDFARFLLSCSRSPAPIAKSDASIAFRRRLIEDRRRPATDRRPQARVFDGRAVN